MPTIKSTINPLAFLEVDEPWAGLKKEEVGPDQILKFLCAPDTPRAVADLVARYKKISVEDPRLFAAPAEPHLLERLIWPLRHAKGSFLLGNLLGTISLCGMVGEMAAILIFDLSGVRLNEKVMDVVAQKQLFGSSFEKLGQERRIEVLRAYGMVDVAVADALDTIRVKRRRYLHLWSADHATLENDAIECYKAAVFVVVAALGLSVNNGKLVLREAVFEYLQRHGAAPPEEPADG